MNYIKIIKDAMLLLLFAMVSLGAIAQQKPPLEVYQLPNGLTVILQEDHRRPEIQGFVSTRAGSVNEPVDATGLAHYLEHVLFKGTTQLGTVEWEKEKPHYDKIIELYDQLGKTKDKKQRDAIQLQINEESIKAAEYAVPNEFSRLIAQIGGTNLNAFTSYDNTAYHSTFPSSQLERWLTVYSHIFEQPVFRAFQAELEIVYEEFNMYADRPSERINEELLKNIFKKTPYGRSVIGLPEHLKNPSLTKLQEFFKAFYVPNNMGLILVGDFDSATAKQYIEQTFGKWQSKPLPTAAMEQEEPFKGREFLELKMGPMEEILLAFRTAPLRHEDNIALKLCATLLSNGQSGLLDQLQLDNKVLQAYGMNEGLKNGGAFIFEIVPNAQEFYEGPSLDNISTAEEYKAVVRELDRARIKAMKGSEDMVLEEFEALKKGEFGDWQLESAKQALITDFEMQQESVQAQAFILNNYFANEVDLSYYTNYVENVKKITKEDVLRVANKYLGKDYLAIHVKPGSIKKNNIDKPEYKPLTFPQADAQSAFAKQFAAIPAPEQPYKFIDFNTDLQKVAMTNGNTLYHSKNPVNDIFSLTIRYEVGQSTIKELDYASLLNYAGGAARDAKGLKGQFARLNCDYSINANKNYVYVSLRGPEQNLRQALTYLNLFINETNLPKNQLSRLAESQRYARKRQKEEPNSIAGALNQYVLYGNKSDYLDRLSIKDLMRIKADELVTAFKMATEYSATIFYTGAKPASEIKSTLEQTVKFAASPKPGKGYQEREKQAVPENTVYMVNESALQSQIIFFANGKPFVPAEFPKMEAYNAYLSGGFTGLMMQEIREYRSLAYGASGRYSVPGLPAKPGWFSGSIQTQDDKTNAAIDVFMGLINDMPQKPERMDVLRNSLILSGATEQPDFRDIGEYYDALQRLGYSDDPLKIFLPAYKALTFDDIVHFNNEYVKNQPKAIMIVGPKKRIDAKVLSKYGVIKELKLNDIFSKDDE
ncbi:MAG: insulinase family protein [Prevotellaceae bacterium]|jgi:predicted Zn-dependent peptidase|nr:insulinase family protein [Prevotellaceae bacterium]